MVRTVDVAQCDRGTRPDQPDLAFETAFNRSPVRMLCCDRDYIIRHINDAFLRHESFLREETVGRSIAKVFGEAFFRSRKPALDVTLAGQPQSMLEWGTRRASRGRLLRIRQEPVVAPDGDVTGVLLMIEDTTALHDLTSRVSMHDEVFRQSSECMAVIGSDFRYLWSNPANAASWGLTHEEIIGRDLVSVIGERHFAELAREKLSACFGGETLQYEYEHIDPTGKRIFYEVRLQPFREADGKIKGAVVSKRDVTRATMMARQLRRQASEDFLTGLANRYALEEELRARLKKCLAKGDDDWTCMPALILVDLDDFKAVNDLGGHSAGDALLRQVAGLLRAAAGERACVARVGGDEFALVLSVSGRAEAIAIGNRIVSMIDMAGFNWEGTYYAVGASVGIAMLDKDMTRPLTPTVFDVINWADKACLVAKEKGGARVSFYHPDDSEMVARLEDAGNLRVVQKALQEDSFELFTMPVMPIDGRSLPSREVLLRIVGEDGAVLSPASFIASAERHGMMSRVDRWVVTTVLRRLRYYRERVRFSVNLSGQSVGDPRFKAFLLDALDAEGVGIDRLSFEITETAAVRSMETAQSLIKALRARGCGIILDDFGSGLSSFGYLRQFQVDMLKIDGAIIGEIVEDRVQQTIVAGIVAVAEAMNVSVIAEYVDSEEAMMILQGLGVHFVQGYHIGKPEIWEEVPGG